MATINYPLTSAAAHAVHSVPRLARAVLTRLAAIAALCLAATAVAGFADRGPLADVLDGWAALSVMGSLIVVAVLSIATLGAADTHSDSDLFDVR
jgi:hypothetical protein